MRFAPLVPLALAIGCGGGGSTPQGGGPPPPNGSLAITFKNAPAAGASATVIGSGGPIQTVTDSSGSASVSLAPGTYAIGASAASGAPGSNSILVPVISPNPAMVTSGGTASVTVTYSPLSTNWQTMGPHAVKIVNGIPAAGKLDAVAIDVNSPLMTLPTTVPCTGANCAAPPQIHSAMFVAGGIYNGPGTNAGIYKSTDGGQTWTQADGAGLTDPGVGALWIDPNTSCATACTLVAGAWTQGLFQSTNGGATWTLTGAYPQASALLATGSKLFAATRQGVYSSMDSGKTWAQEQATTTPVRSLAADPAGAMIYAGLDDGRVLTWTGNSGWKYAATPAIPAGSARTALEISVSPASAQTACVVEAGYYATPDLYCTSNGGGSWTTANPLDRGGNPVAVQTVAFDPSDATGKTIYIGADVFFGKSTDGGSTWAQVLAPSGASAGAWWDERSMFGGAGGIANHVMIAADQGLYLTPDGGNTWFGLNGNLTASIVYVAAVKGSTIVTTMQDLGPLVSFDAGQTWDSHASAHPPGSEGGTALINPGNPNYVYVYTGWGFQLSTDGGKNFSYSNVLTNAAFPGCAGNSQLIAADAQNPANVYAAAWNCENAANAPSPGVYKSGDYGQSWAREPWPATQPVSIAIDPSNDKNIFVGEGDGTLQVSHDGGQSWTSVAVGRSGGQTWWPVSIAVSPLASNIVMVGLNGPPGAGGGVLRSTDGGATFTPVNSGLDTNPLYPAGQPWPDAIFRLAYDPASGALVAARFSGVYLSTDNGANWISIQGNAVPGFFSSATFDSGNLFVTTFGEGLLSLSGPF